MWEVKIERLDKVPIGPFMQVRKLAEIVFDEVYFGNRLAQRRAAEGVNRVAGTRLLDAELRVSHAHPVQPQPEVPVIDLREPEPEIVIDLRDGVAQEHPDLIKQ